MARGGFPGMMGGGNMQQLARQAQKLQQQMNKMQEELEAREYEASAGGGMVTVKVTGKKELVSLEIKPEAVDPDDIEMLQDMVMAAVNEALRTAGDTMEREMGKLTGGLLGSLLRGGIKEKYSQTLNYGLALCVMIIGIGGALKVQNMLAG